MKKKIITATLSILIGLTMLVAVVPIGASDTPENVSVPYYVFGCVQNIDEDLNAKVTFTLTSSSHPSILYYDFDEGKGDENLEFTVTTASREITDDEFEYLTTIYDKDGKDFIAWLGEPYFVVEAGGDWYLSKLLVDEDEDDSHLLRVGESLSLAEGFAITPQEIDVDGGEVWFSITLDGEEVESSVVIEDYTFVYEEDLNESGEEDNEVLSFVVETVLADMNTNLVKINTVQLVSNRVLKVETPDTDVFSGFEINDNANEDTLLIKFEDSDDEISLKKDGIVNLLGERFWFWINEDGTVGALVVRITKPGTYEIFAAVKTDFDDTDAEFHLTSADHPSILYYDFDEGEGQEILDFTVNAANREITKGNFLYETSIYKGGTNNDEDYIAWLGQPYYVVEPGGDWYLSELLVDEDEDDYHLLRIGASLSLPDGFAITPLEIDVDGGEAWFSITQDGEEVDSSVIKEHEKYVYKSDLWVLTFNLESVLEGMNTNLVIINEVQLKYVMQSGDDWYLSKLLVDEDSDDTHLLRVGESLALAEGFAIAPQEIDVDGGEVWFSITQNGEEVESSVAKEDAEFIYKADLNESGEEDNWVLKFNIETVFAGMNTNLVKINSLQLISPDVLKIETPDDDTFSYFEITSPNDTTLQIKLDNEDDEISLKKDGIVNFLGRFWFRINEDGDVGGICKVVEVGGEGATPTETEDGEVDETGDVNQTGEATETGTE